MLSEHGSPVTQPYRDRASAVRAQAMRMMTRTIAHGIGQAVSTVAARIGRLSAQAALWRRRRAAMRELQGLDDRALRDIGIYRSDIWWVADSAARGAAVRPPRPAFQPAAAPVRAPAAARPERKAA